MTSRATRGGKQFHVQSDQPSGPQALAVTVVTCEGQQVATWRTAFSPDLPERDPATVERLLARQHEEVMELLEQGAFDHAAGIPPAEISVAEAETQAAARPPSASPTDELLPLASPAAPTTPPGSIPHNHPAFAGIPMLDWQSGDGEPGLEVDAPPPVDAPAADADSPKAEAPLPPMPSPPTPAPPTPSATSPAALHEGAASRTRPKRPSLPALPVARLAEDQARVLGDPAPIRDKPRR